MPIKIQGLDHLVLTVSDIERSVRFYCGHLGMRKIEFGEGRIALGFGRQKINLHQAGKEFEPHAARPLSGSADLCLIIDGELSDAIEQLRAGGIDIIEGPVMRTGASGAIESIYLRDPDGNLLELSTYGAQDDH